MRLDGAKSVTIDFSGPSATVVMEDGKTASEADARKALEDNSGFNLTSFEQG